MIKYDNLHFFVKIRRTIRRKGQKTGFLSPFFCAKISSKKNMNPDKFRIHTIGCGGRTRTSDLWVMSPTSCQLLYPAISVLFFTTQLYYTNLIFMSILCHSFFNNFSFFVTLCRLFYFVSKKIWLLMAIWV